MQFIVTLYVLWILSFQFVFQNMNRCQLQFHKVKHQTYTKIFIYSMKY